ARLSAKASLRQLLHHLRSAIGAYAATSKTLSSHRRETFVMADSATSELVATPVSPTEVSLYWGTVPDGAPVDLRRCVGADCSLEPNTRIQTGLPNPGTYRDTGLAHGTTYRYQVTGSNGYYRATATTPLGLVATPVSQTEIDLVWGTVPDG